MVATTLVLHVIVLGYWLGAEFVINSTFRYVTYATGLAYRERARLLDHVMVVDQHVRYALALQFGLGLILANQLGYVAGGRSLMLVIAIATISLLALVEATHRLRARPAGVALARLDRFIRVVLVLAFVAAGLASLAGAVELPGWFAAKLALFGLVIACGLAIRLFLIGYFGAFGALGNQPDNEELEARLRAGYVRSTAVLVLLWLAILAITVLSITKPV